MTKRGALMGEEIHAQPQALQRLLDHGQGAISDAANAVRARLPRFVLLAARGTSDHVALYAKYSLEIALGLPCGLVSASTVTGYHARPHLGDVLWIAVSQSGGSPDLVESTRVARERGALTIAVTNAPGSALDEVAELSVPIHAGEERAVAATTSYTNQLLALRLLVDAIAGERRDADIAAVPALVAEVLRREQEQGAVRALAARYRFVDRLVVTGRGYSYPSAREAALKLMETSYLAAHAFSGADLLHGPMAMIDQDRPVIAIADAGVGGNLLDPVLSRLAEREADLAIVADERRLASWSAFGGHHISLPAAPEELAPILQIVPMQLLALQMATARGYDPDAPRGLLKVTRTR